MAPQKLDYNLANISSFGGAVTQKGHTTFALRASGGNHLEWYTCLKHNQAKSCLGTRWNSSIHTRLTGRYLQTHRARVCMRMVSLIQSPCAVYLCSLGWPPNHMHAPLAIFNGRTRSTRRAITWLNTRFKLRACPYVRLICSEWFTNIDVDRLTFGFATALRCCC